MDEEAKQARPGRPRWLGPVGLVAAGLLAGGILAGTLSAGAQSSSPTPSATAEPKERRGDGAGETLLTGATAERVRAAALEAVPGGTILRVETDSDGSPYEAHVRKSDGSEVTVKVNEAFDVTEIEEGHGRHA